MIEKGFQYLGLTCNEAVWDLLWVADDVFLYRPFPYNRCIHYIKARVEQARTQSIQHHSIYTEPELISLIST